jgi:hypothetical protein
MNWDSMTVRLGAVLLAGLFIVLWLLIKRRQRQSKVTRLASHKKLRISGQKCSYCKRKSSELAFYSGNDGRVVGVCRQCRPQAERQALMRL